MSADREAGAGAAHPENQPGIRLDVGKLKKGIDNYHIDMQLSPVFVESVLQVAEEGFKRMVGRKPPMEPNAPELTALKASYTDMMSAVIHRTKTDLTPEQVVFCQFGVVKSILVAVRNALDDYMDQLKESAVQQQETGSANVMSTQDRILWFARHRNTIQFRLNQLIMKPLQREENNHLRQLRGQYLGKALPESVAILFNPLLQSDSPEEPEALLQYYGMWAGAANKPIFGEVNERLEAVFAEVMPELPVVPLKAAKRAETARAEIYDELGGLLASQPLLGPAEDQGEAIAEEFCALESPQSVRAAFEDSGDGASEGLSGWWQDRKARAKAGSLQKAIGRALEGDEILKKIVAGYELRSLWNESLSFETDPWLACRALVSAKDLEKLGTTLAARKDAEFLQKQFGEAFDKVSGQLKDEYDEKLKLAMADVCRYRMHLKYYRFANRVFNRINILTDDRDIALARQGGHLYAFLGSEEAVEASDVIVHHTILKADVRGSTTVTAELEKQELNPASYFSLRFFDPISKVLETYGAEKVFIEGDAVILSIVEFEDRPDEWFSVSRACGLAREILDIVASKNAHSSRMGLPVLELGIGICYLDEKPLYLYDGDRPIMISSAIGAADRLSSCSWKLRAELDKSDFNVAVFKPADGEEGGDKGQSYLQYNVNGIRIAPEAFAKLKTEMVMQQVRLKVAGDESVYHLGSFPDVAGKKRDLVIREGRVRAWPKGGGDADTKGSSYYEIVVNQRVLNGLKKAQQQKARKKPAR